MITFGRRQGPRMTVGIPVYNDEAHIGALLDSVLAQTMSTRQIEVICVDDGSTDATMEILESYCGRFPRGSLRILTQANTGGPATGRNRILEEARGTFTFFVDSDDYLGPNALTSMYARGQECGADVVIGKFVGVGRGVPKYIFRKSTAATTMEETTVVDSLNVLKAFRTSFARRLPYRFDPTLRMAEDHPFAMCAYIHTDTIAIEADADCYFWVRHADEQSAGKHLTGHVLPVEEFYRYFYAVFHMIESSTEVPASRREFARAAYWNRLLTFDLVTEFRRKRDEDDAQRSLETARSIAEEFGASAASPALSPKARFMLLLLTNGDLELLRVGLSALR